jgi:hypothetical protein
MQLEGGGHHWWAARAANLLPEGLGEESAQRREWESLFQRFSGRSFDAATNLQFDRRAFKSKPLSQLIHKVALVRKVEGTGFVGKYHK